MVVELEKEEKKNRTGNRKERTSTSTSNFGVTRREGHDSSRFYARFSPPEISVDDQIVCWNPPDPFICGDSTSMDAIPDNSVALVVTSPPYFVGKEYEEAVGEGHVPATYIDYLDMLFRVFEQCKRKLEPGGRIAVNVANLGRKPYRSLSADVIRILQDDLKFLMRGEVIWWKADGLNGSCAWGSFRRATNPVLRDTSERVIIASKGRFDRAVAVQNRRILDWPHESTLGAKDFMEATLDVWRGIPPESATRVGHPAPFPVGLPKRLIELYTFKGDVVLDPFMGSGTTLVAAAKTGRSYVGYDIDPDYVDIARKRVAAEGTTEPLASLHVAPATGVLPVLQFGPPIVPNDMGFQRRSNLQGEQAQKDAHGLLDFCGFRNVLPNQHFTELGLEINLVAEDQKGRRWFFDVSGAYSGQRPGLVRTDTLWKALGRVLVLKRAYTDPLILLTTDLPQQGSAGYRALHAVGCHIVFDAIRMDSGDGQARLRQYATGECSGPIPGFWTKAELNAAERDRNWETT